jgi:hypothetical protein
MMTIDDHLNDRDLSALLDEQVTPEQQTEFPAHLAECSECAGNYAMLRHTKQALRELASVDLPRDFRLPSTSLPSTLPSQQKSFFRYTISAAAIIVGLFFIVTANTNLTQQSSLFMNSSGSPQLASCTDSVNPCYSTSGSQTKDINATLTPIFGPATTLTPTPFRTYEPAPTHVISTPPNTPTHGPPTEATQSHDGSDIATQPSPPFNWELWGQIALGLALIGSGLLYWIRTRQIAK